MSKDKFNGDEYMRGLANIGKECNYPPPQPEFNYLSRWAAYRMLLGDDTPPVITRLATGGLPAARLSKQDIKAISGAAHRISKIAPARLRYSGHRTGSDIDTIRVWHLWLFAAGIVQCYASPQSGLKNLMKVGVFESTAEQPVMTPDYWQKANGASSPEPEAGECELVKNALRLMDRVVLAFSWIANGANWSARPIAEWRLNATLLAQELAAAARTHRTGASAFILSLEQSLIAGAVERAGENKPSTRAVSRWIRDGGPCGLWNVTSMAGLKRWAKRYHNEKERARAKRLADKNNTNSVGNREIRRSGAVLPAAVLEYKRPAEEDPECEKEDPECEKEATEPANIYFDEKPDANRS
ncbi:MAG: hypothetical protein PHI85_04245 [Victivallaceae bacterium]|nr:hypothetical protein [Victivallaceae bacterium]